MKRIWLALALCLSACGDEAPVSRAEAEDIASDYATDTSDLESRLSDIESERAEMEAKIAELEAKDADLEAQDAQIQSDIVSLNEAVQDVESNSSYGYR